MLGGEDGVVEADDLPEDAHDKIVRVGRGVEEDVGDGEVVVALRH